MGLGRAAGGDRRQKDLAVYARRMARLLFLRRHVEEDHPVLAAENILIEMARSKLLEGLLASVGEAGLSRERPSVERAIREEMKMSISRLVSDPERVAALHGEAESEPMDSVFTPRGR